MSLIGKTINVSDKSLLGFLYPGFVTRTNLFFDHDNRVIYVGDKRPDLIRYLASGTKEFINTVGFCDVDLDVRDSLISLIYSKFNKEPKTNTLNILKGMPEQEFLRYIKQCWVGGRFSLDEDSEYTIFDLYVAMTKSGKESLKVYYHLLKRIEFNIIQSSIETFLEKVADIRDISASGAYTKVLNDFNSRHRKKLQSILYVYYTMKEPREHKIRWLLYQL